MSVALVIPKPSATFQFMVASFISRAVVRQANLFTSDNFTSEHSMKTFFFKIHTFISGSISGSFAVGMALTFTTCHALFVTNQTIRLPRTLIVMGARVSFAPLFLGCLGAWFVPIRFNIHSRTLVLAIILAAVVTPAVFILAAPTLIRNFVTRSFWF